MIDDRQRHEQAQQVFAHLRNLSFGTIQADGGAALLTCVRGLCRAPWAAVLRRDSSVFAVVGTAPEASAVSVSAADFSAQRAAALGPKLDRQGYAFEPWRTGAPEAGELTEPFLLIFRLGGDPESVVALVTEHADQDRFNEVVVRSQLLASIVHRGDKSPAPETGATGGVAGGPSTQVLELVDEVMNQDRFEPATLTLVDALAVLFGASRVSLGWQQGTTMRAAAVSGLENFDRATGAITELEAVFEEVVDLEKTIWVRAAPPMVESAGARDDVSAAARVHRRLLTNKALTHLISLPLWVAHRPVGALVLEWSEGEPPVQTAAQVEVAAQLVANWLNVLHRRERSVWTKATDTLREAAAGWLGPRHTLAKLVVVVISSALILAALIRVDFEIDATATLETDRVSYLAAPFNGFVREVNTETGEEVKSGQMLIALDSEELELRELEETAQLQRFRSEVEKARASRDLVDMKVAQAQVRQAETELERTRYYLSRATLAAAFDGIVVEGERRELVGAPVAQGDVLMKLADPSQLFVRIKLNERDIDYVSRGTQGAIRLLSQPDAIHAFAVTRVVPAAMVDPAEGNVFILRAQLTDGQEPWWRPGMSGTVKLQAGRRPLLAVWFHRTWEAIRMWLWI